VLGAALSLSSLLGGTLIAKPVALLSPAFLDIVLLVVVGLASVDLVVCVCYL